MSDGKFYQCQNIHKPRSSLHLREKLFREEPFLDHEKFTLLSTK